MFNVVNKSFHELYEVWVVCMGLTATSPVARLRTLLSLEVYGLLMVSYSHESIENI